MFKAYPASVSIKAFCNKMAWGSCTNCPSVLLVFVSRKASRFVADNLSAFVAVDLDTTAATEDVFAVTTVAALGDSPARWTRSHKKPMPMIISRQTVKAGNVRRIIQ